MKLWKKWCCWKEIWNPYDIFIPVIIFLIVCFLGFFSKNIIIGFLMGFIFGVITGLMMFLNWKAYS